MCHKILAAVAIVVAVVLAILAVTLSPDKMSFVILISRFFEVMIPVLAVAALLKYLCCCPHTHKHE
jgi:uncharacterized Tic20 family protein